MPHPTIALVHSPLVGPLTWRAVATTLADAGWRATVPDLTEALAGPGPYQPRIAQLVAAHLRPEPAPVVLVGHSGAGPLLPGIAATLPTPVQALIYVDAGLPYPGRSWWQTAPAELVAHLDQLSNGGQLPPWHEWFPPELLSQLLPDPRLRAQFTAELQPLPIDYFHEPTPPVDWPRPAGYLQLSEAYQDDAAQATELGWPVISQPSDHLAPLHSPAQVADALTGLLTTAPLATTAPAP